MEIANNAVNLRNGGNGRTSENQENQLQVVFRQYCRGFCNNRRVINHLRFCSPAPVNDEVNRPPLLAAVNEVDNNLNGADDVVPEQQFFWGNTPGNQAVEQLKECYEKIVFWCKNFFMLTKGSSGKDWIKEITKLINEWSIGSPNRESTMYALHVMPVLLLQKPSTSLKCKDYVAILKRRLQKWKNGEFLQLLRETTALQSWLPNFGTMWYQESFMNI